MYYLYYKKTCVQFYYNSTYLFTKINHKAMFHSYSNSYCNNICDIFVIQDFEAIIARRTSTIVRATSVKMAPLAWTE